jgi:catechol 2,3-dioxygenase-like lactoylglutathione lyase family enzyme
MDYNAVSAPEFGRALTGIGVNVLVRDVGKSISFLETVLGMTGHQVTRDFAIVTGSGGVLQLHADGTYHSNPLLGLLPETPPRGAGVELRLYGVDPDQAMAAAQAFEGATILQDASDKPHGLRECYILCPDGYAWVPSRPLEP